MDHNGGIQASLAGRYATALFELARERKAVDMVEVSLRALEDAMSGSDELRRLAASPLVSRAAAGGAIREVAAALRLDALTTDFLGVLAANRRLGQAGAVIAAFRQLAASFRGEATADVTTAHPLDERQLAALRTKLRARMGRDVAVNLRTDPAILGGLIVKIGSQLIDGSIRTRLNTLATAMKG